MLPRIPGIYFAVKRRRILYIGQSKNIRARWQSHHRYSELKLYGDVDIYWTPAFGQPLNKLEKEWIKAINPPLNGVKVLGIVEMPVPAKVFYIWLILMAAFIFSLIYIIAKDGSMFIPFSIMTIAFAFLIGAVITRKISGRDFLK